MDIIIDIILLIICLFFLIKGSEWILKGAVALAERFGISKLAIASTLIAFGTGLPTIAVSIFLILFAQNGSEIAMGTVIGTSFVNIGLGLGIPAMLLTIVTKYEVFEKEIPLFLGLTGIITAFALDGRISRIEGIIILAIYIITLFVIYQYSLKEKSEKKDEIEFDVDSSTISETVTKRLTAKKSVGFVFIGFISLIFSALVLVALAPKLSLDFSISEYILGVTIIGIGTSIPMIVTSVRSAKKKYIDIIVGNVFGSTIANMALGIGLPSIIVPFVLNKESISDIYYFNLLNIVVLFCLLVEMKLIGKRRTFNWASGLIIISIYLVYLFLKFF